MPSKQTIAVVFALTLAVWLLFYIKTPDAPLGASEMAIVVAVCGGVVIGVQRIAGALRKGGRKDAKPVESRDPSTGGGAPKS